MTTRPTVVWFHNDLRLTDNPALDAAINRGGPIVCFYCWCPGEYGDWEPGSASRSWLHHSLTSLTKSIDKAGNKLIIAHGKSLSQLKSLLEETDAEALYVNRRYEPALEERDAAVVEALDEEGFEIRFFEGSSLFEFDAVKTQNGDPYKVFTPFWKSIKKLGEPREPLPTHRKIPALDRMPDSLVVDDLKLLSAIKWDLGFYKTWEPGEMGAQKQLGKFLADRLENYPEDRDYPDTAGTSELSPHLHFGEISSVQIWHTVREHAAHRRRHVEKEADSYLREIVWREFSIHVLHYFPFTTNKPLRQEFAAFPWLSNRKHLKAWQRGETGYPLVDAGMRQLWEIGWMHNRVRMVAASFLTKHLLIPWQEGAKWFWDTLLDADLANNTMGWQWAGGCGADAAPYFRIFNPTLQAKKFDPEGYFIRRWVPELSDLPDNWIHRPFEAPEEVLEEAGIELGKDYPKPIVGHSEARDRALKAYKELKR